MMLKYVILLCTLTFSLSPILAQNKKPKVALVLSGGGAKGIAHIPLLQAIDSLGIVPDLVVGNSMGSIVGGLYAMGYSGDKIATLSKKADWDNLIGGILSLDDVSNEEKNEFNQYFTSASVIEKKVRISSFILSDQNLRTFIASLTYPVYNISNFDSLPIPFRAIATDIVAGEEVILDQGSLAMAMRASMSIPAIFSAVPYKNTLLIDGGVLNNFPVDVAKNMGADFIIGSDVGNGMLPKEGLDNISALLFQSGMLVSNIKNPKNRALCDILLSHGPNISYDTGDFNQAPTIYEQGKTALKEALPQLVEISKELKSFTQRKHYLPVAPDTLVLNDIVYSGISEDNINLIKARSNLKPQNGYTEKEISKGINRLIGTALFSNVIYGLVDKEEKTELFLNASEIPNHQVKGAVHYDNELGAGLILNYTGRNLIGETSRTLATVDLAKNPKIRVQQQNILGQKKKWWMRTEVFANKYRQGLFSAGFRVDDVKYQFLHLSSQINRNLSPLKSFVGVGVEYENSIIKPTVPPDVLEEEGDALKKYKFQTLYAAARFKFNTIDKQYYATKGSSLHLTYKRSFDNNLDIDVAGEEPFTFAGVLANHHKLIIEATNRWPITSKLTAISGVSGAFIFEDDLKNEELSYVDNEIGVKYFLGGSTVLARSGSFLMPGLKEGEVLASQFVKANVAFQYALQQKMFLTPHIDAVVFGINSFTDFTKNITSLTSDWNNATETGFILSTGLTASYDSIFGPINVDFSLVNGIDKFRFFVGFGYSFVGL